MKSHGWKDTLFGPVLVMTAARATCASNPAGASNTAVVPGECIGANPSHLLVQRLSHV